MKINSDIIEAAARYATECLTKDLNPAYVYHNLTHTLAVVKSTDILCREMEISNADRKILVIAAWFHDLGYIQKIEDHEKSGAAMAVNFLKEYAIEEAEIEKVKLCILATHYPQHPLTLMEMILCDADLMHLSGKKCMETSCSLRKEWEITRHTSYSDKEWYELNLSFLNAHKYHTSYGQTVLEKGKKKNIKKLETLLEDSEQMPGDMERGNDRTAVSKKKKEKETSRGKGVETFLRIASGNHMRLSSMADTKAHILLSISSIIISIVMSLLANKLTEATYLVVPTIILLVVSLVTIVFAVLTTRPKVTKGVFTTEQIKKREINLLFFGNFHRMEADTYDWGIKEMMNDKDYLYSSMTKDIYFLGKVLAVKYHYLNIGYKVFMYGIISSVIAYTISFYIAFHSAGL